MMSAVQTKLNGVFRSSLSFRSSHRLRQVERRPCCPAPCDRSYSPSKVVNGGHRLAVLLVALHRAERQPQGERRVRVGARPVHRELGLGDRRVRLPLRLLDLGLEPLADRPGLRRRPAGPARSSGPWPRRPPPCRPRTASCGPSTSRTFVPLTSSYGPLARRLAGQHLLHQLVVRRRAWWPGTSARRPA